MKSVLLGGSNSVFENGMVSGLRECTELTRLSLGATSCAQNLFEIVRRSEEVRKADLVVTESNVNDSFNYSLMDLSLDFILQQIDEYYLELSKITKRVYVVILPINQYLPGVEPSDVVDAINGRHLANCLHHGFRVVDVATAFKKMNNQDVMNLVPHARHLNEAIQHQIAVNICRHAKENPFSFGEFEVHNSQYVILTPDKMGGVDGRTKANSRFSEVVFKLDSELVLPSGFCGWNIKAISTWSDGYSILKINGESPEASKAFRDAIMVVELEKEFHVCSNTVVSSSFENIRASEKTPLVSFSPSELPSSVGLIAILLRSGNAPKVDLTEEYSRGDICCGSIIPNMVPYARSFQTWINLNKVVSQSKYDSLLDSFRKIGSQVDAVIKSAKVAITTYIPLEYMDVFVDSFGVFYLA